mgnify:CR=1 FL=1
MIPTPTPLPAPGTMPIEMPDTSIWDMAPHAIQTWNSFNEITIAFQAILIVVMAGVIFMIFTRIINSITTDE